MSEEMLELHEKKSSRYSIRGQKKVISVCVNPELLAKFDDYGQNLGLGRSELISYLMMRVVSECPKLSELYDPRPLFLKKPRAS